MYLGYFQRTARRLGLTGAGRPVMTGTTGKATPEPFNPVRARDATVEIEWDLGRTGLKTSSVILLLGPTSQASCTLQSNAGVLEKGLQTTSRAAASPRPWLPSSHHSTSLENHTALQSQRRVWRRVWV